MAAQRPEERHLVYLLGYPGVGKYTIGRLIAEELDAVLVDNMVILTPILTVFRWDGKSQLPPGTLERADPIREAVLTAIEEIGPPSNSYVFTDCIPQTPEGRGLYERVRALAGRTGSTFLPVLVTCDIEQQEARIGSADRIARMKGSDPERYIRYTLTVPMFVPPAEDRAVTLDTTSISATEAAARLARIVRTQQRR